MFAHVNEKKGEMLNKQFSQDEVLKVLKITLSTLDTLIFCEIRLFS